VTDREQRQDRLHYGEALRRIRRDRGTGLNELAARAGVSPSYLSEVERGFKRPSTDVLASLAGALDMAPSELLAYIEAFAVASGLAPGMVGEAAQSRTPASARHRDMDDARTRGSQRRAEFIASLGPLPPAPRHRQPAPSTPLQSQAGDATTHAPSAADDRSESRGAHEQSLNALAKVARALSDRDLKLVIDLARRLLSGESRFGR
jgi:transcriptional regulator with XRE-family HTH domain